MKVVFLCGGMGKRMFPINEDKFLLKFLGKTLLEHQIERARKAGLSDFVVVAGPQNIIKVDEISKRLEGIRAELALQVQPLQGQPLGIADALRCAERFLDGASIVVNPNDVFDGSAYGSLIETGMGDSAVSCLLGYEVKDYFPGGYLVVDENDGLKHIVEKPGRGREPSNLVNIVVHLHTDPKRLLKYAETIESSRDDVYERAIDSMVKAGCKVKIVPYGGFWAPIKYPWHIFDVVRGFLDECEGYISASARVSEKATIEGNVIIGDNVRVLEHAVIRGPAYVGPNSVIGNNSLVRDYSHIGADCVVGYSTEVKGSYIGDRCWFHSNYIGDSIVGEGCSFGAGAVLANFRFDEATIRVRVQGEDVDSGRDKLGAMIGSDSKIGINASIMPGVRIGPNSIVGSHVCLTKDLGAGEVALAEPGYVVVTNRAGLEEESGVKTRMRLERLQCAE